MMLAPLFVLYIITLGLFLHIVMFVVDFNKRMESLTGTDRTLPNLVVLVAMLLVSNTNN